MQQRSMPINCHCDLQVVVISDPMLAAEVLDRSKYPDLIDKPSDPMFYKAFDEVCGNLHP